MRRRRRISQDKDYNKKGESDKDSLGDNEESFSDSDEPDSDGYDALDGLNFKIFENISRGLITQLKLEESSSKSSSESSLSENCLTESDSEDNFHPEIFGLLEDPGVVRFECVDYPLDVIKHSEDKDLGEETPGWMNDNLKNADNESTL